MAYLDFGATRELCKAISYEEAPAPNATRYASKEIGVDLTTAARWRISSHAMSERRRSHSDVTSECDIYLASIVLKPWRSCPLPKVRSRALESTEPHKRPADLNNEVRTTF